MYQQYSKPIASKAKRKCLPAEALRRRRRNYVGREDVHRDREYAYRNLQFQYTFPIQHLIF